MYIHMYIYIYTYIYIYINPPIWIPQLMETSKWFYHTPGFGGAADRGSALAELTGRVERKREFNGGLMVFELWFNGVLMVFELWFNGV